MAGPIIPSVKPLMLCEEIDEEGGLRNVYGLFTSLPAEFYPHVRESFCVFAQLSGGLGTVPFYFDIRRASDERLIHTSIRQTLDFRDRTQLIQLAVTFRNVRFEQPGVYLVELYCDNTWVADVTLTLTEYTP
jgi:hypothetical protein